MSDKKNWIIKIVPALAFAAGIIMSSIAGTMTLSSAAKLALFDSDPYSYVTRDDCRIDYHAPMYADNDQVQKTERTESEIDACVAEKKQKEKQQFQSRHEQNLVDGISTLIIGLILVAAFRKRK